MVPASSPIAAKVIAKGDQREPLSHHPIPPPNPNGAIMLHFKHQINYLHHRDTFRRRSRTTAPAPNAVMDAGSGAGCVPNTPESEVKVVPVGALITSTPVFSKLVNVPSPPLATSASPTPTSAAAPVTVMLPLNVIREALLFEKLFEDQPVI